MYDEQGVQVWTRTLDINGKIIKESAHHQCPFTFQGQYYDSEINLSYNRFRYYDAEDGRYISEDPIGLASGEFGFYNYVEDSNWWIDPLGLKQSVYVLKKKDKIVYIGITNDPKRRKGEHKRDNSKDFDEMVVIIDFDSGNNSKDRINARNVEGSLLDQQQNNSLIQNRRRKPQEGETKETARIYHSYDANNVKKGRTYGEVDIDNMISNGTTIN